MNDGPSGGSTPVIVDGVKISFVRRRYGRTTYTWLHAFINGAWDTIGDPWPCLNPPKREIKEALKCAVNCAV